MEKLTPAVISLLDIFVLKGTEIFFFSLKRMLAKLLLKLYKYRNLNEATWTAAHCRGRSRQGKPAKYQEKKHKEESLICDVSKTGRVTSEVLLLCTSSSNTRCWMRLQFGEMLCFCRRCQRTPVQQLGYAWLWHAVGNPLLALGPVCGAPARFIWQNCFCCLGSRWWGVCPARSR